MPNEMEYDFGGYATKVDLPCSDGRVIKRGAFKCDGMKVPLVWHHRRDDPSNVLGHALLRERDDGVYAYCSFNKTEKAQMAKEAVEHGDITCLSIYANQLKHRGCEVIHGQIREVSLVTAGANPGAVIDNVYIQHEDGDGEFVASEAFMSFPTPFEFPDEMSHSDEGTEPQSQNGSQEDEIQHEEGKEVAEKSEKTIKEVFETLTDEQKEVVYAMIGYAMEQSGIDEDDDEESVEHSEKFDDEEETFMKHNVFDNDTKENSLSHEEQQAIFADARKFGSLKDACLEHGIDNLEILFPEAQALRPTPDLITRNMDWVSKVWNGTNKSPFSRIKSVSANLTADEARAKGYIKGKKKIEEQFGLLKRVTTPQTIYKKQKLDRDDVIDITSFDVVAWLKAEMRMMLNEELARVILIDDGRPTSSDDKINPLNIRNIHTDDDMYTIKQEVDLSSTDKTDRANAIIDAAHLARIDYKGSGSPTFFAAPSTIVTMLLARDKIGHRLYNTVSELAAAMGVREIVEVPVFEGVKRAKKTGDTTSVNMNLLGIIVNLKDYTIGADRGGAVAMFDDFDIDYNQMKYLIETRCSGALTLPYSAIVLESSGSLNPAPTPSTPSNPGNGGGGDGGDDDDT